MGCSTADSRSSGPGSLDESGEPGEPGLSEAMDEHFTPWVLAVALPLGYLAARLGLWSRPSLRGWIAFFLAALVFLHLPGEEVAHAFLRRWNLLLLAAVTAVLVLRHYGVAWAADRRGFAVALALLAGAALASHTRLLAFHGGGAWIHRHDVAHYYLGSKYFGELGYGELYVAALRAELEEYGHLQTPEARDLRGNYLVPVGRLLERSDAVRERFSDERWGAFRLDVRLFRETMGPRWGDVLKDHGYNPTPAWTLVGGALANRVPAGSAGGVFVLTLLDPLLLAVTFLVVGRTFGAPAAFLVAIYWATAFGAAFSWKGGAFLRELSFVSMLIAASLAGRGRAALAGCALALAAMLRIYPGLLAAGPFFLAAFRVARGEDAREPVRFLVAFTATVAGLAAATALVPGGLSHWSGFLSNIAEHSRSISSNVLGVTNGLTYLAGTGVDASTPEGFETLTVLRQTVYRAQLATLFLFGLVVVARQSRREELPGAIALGAPLVFLGLNLSAYYYVFLALVVVARRNRPRDLALVFSVELLTHAIALFEAHEVMLYLYKSMLLGWLFVALHLLDGSGDASSKPLQN